MTHNINALAILSKKYPHSVNLLQAFGPLLEAKGELAASLPAPALNNVKPQASGGPLLPPQDNIPIYLDDFFIKKAPAVLCAAARKGFAQKSAELDKLAALFEEDARAAFDLARLSLAGKARRISYWAGKHGQDKDVAGLLSAHMAAAAAGRVRAACGEAGGEGALCPVCGRRPQAGFIRDKEGHRYMRCSLCGCEWRFSRTTCPGCADEDPAKRQIFFLDDDPWFRAEGCDVCRSYLLTPDLREASGDIPLELLLLCLAPLDMLMQDKGYERLPAP